MTPESEPSAEPSLEARIERLEQSILTLSAHVERIRADIASGAAAPASPGSTHGVAYAARAPARRPLRSADAPSRRGRYLGESLDLERLRPRAFCARSAVRVNAMLALHDE